MEVIIAPSPELVKLAADAIDSLLRSKPNGVIGLATGSSPLAIYDELARRHDEEGLDFSQARGFMLDEYVGLPADHPERYRNVIEKEIASRVGWPADQVQGPNGLADNLAEAGPQYDEAIKAAGGVDIQILGIGTDGHIAFNEPGSSLSSRTRMKTLTYQTREDNARFFDDDIEKVPRHCLTQGLGTIMEAKHIILIATGKAKAEAVHQLVEGPISALWPATVLQMHPHCTILLDDAAASRLQLSSYFRDTFASKPSWQGI
jgi:glucosamine-6-phosphate deaminase